MPSVGVELRGRRRNLTSLPLTLYTQNSLGLSVPLSAAAAESEERNHGAICKRQI